ncbi:TPA: hypothetical protein HA338_13605 [Methanosarcina acetivorans]|uniref:Uncharacterized protein n=1 Tax=Methanosarcina acetivorans TaxID=2214 RepID=A0A832W853_9EURY|nr:hypothetical protein [Methanosarcina acetivorans]HIH94999.1 hypothetical protein [Methanosarcina acetivorans]
MRNDPTVAQWLKIVNKRPKIGKAYLPGFQKYVNFTGMPPEELLAEVEAKKNKNKACVSG